jgi:DUF4097 and DUF4098 domain-containing protein YvlB
MNMRPYFCGRHFVILLSGLGLWAQLGLAKDRVQEEFHQTYSLTADGQVRLENVNGKVQFTTWDRQEIQVDAVKKADRQEDLEATKIEIKSKSDSIDIRTKLPKWKASQWRKSNSASVDYEIKVPVGARLAEVKTVNGSLEVIGVRGRVELTTVNGRLVAKGLAADAKLESVNGSVEASFDQLVGVKSVSLNAVNGKIEITIPSNADADISANSLNGRIQADNLTVKKNWPVGSELRGKLGQGGTRIKLETVNGGIRVRQAEGSKAPLAEQPQ